jgi:insulysin
MLLSLLLSIVPLVADSPPPAEIPLPLPYTEVADLSNLPLLNPDFAGLETAKLRLSNGICVYLISDPGADQSAAAVAVEAGSWNDPRDYPGMAHFCEHMLFMGSDFLPSERAFSERVANYGGTTNASTAAQETIYLFSSRPDGFLSILEPFAHFFIDPLFDPSGISRELHAVDQEYARSLEHDGWRAEMVFRALGNPAHPNSAFSCGNAETLKKIPQEALKKWYKDHYGAERMHLILYGPQPIAELKQAATLFSAVPPAAAPRETFPGPLSSAAQTGRLVSYQPVKDSPAFRVMWELSAPLATPENAPAAELIAYALSCGNPHGLAEQLKQQGLIHALAAEVDIRGDTNHRFLDVWFDLTPEGVSRYEEIATALFGALHALQQQGLPGWLADEKRRTAELSYQYQSRRAPFSLLYDLASHIVYEPLETFPRQSVAPLGSPSAETVAELFAFLTPERALFSLWSAPEASPVPQTQKEPWYGALYGVAPLKEETLVAWSAAPPSSIALPEPNPYLPQSLASAPVSGTGGPRLLSSTPFGSAYYDRLPRFQGPQGAIVFRLFSPTFSAGAKGDVLGALLALALEEQLEQPLISARAAGISASFAYEDRELSLSISGFAEKSPLLLNRLLAPLRHDPPSTAAFSRYKERLSRLLANASKEPPLSQAFALADALLVEGRSTSEEQQAALGLLSYEEFSDYYRHLLDAIHFRALFAGNFSEQQAQSALIDIHAELAGDAAPLPSPPRPLALTGQKGPCYLHRSLPVLGNGTLLIIDQGPFSFRTRASQEVLHLALREAFFNELRTRQKTGYVAQTAGREVEQHLYSFLFVQSATHQADELLHRFELFLEDFCDNLATYISPERFLQLQQSQLHLLKTSFRNVSDHAALLAKCAFDLRGDFAFLDKRIDALAKLTYDDFLADTTRSLSRSNPKRLALLMEGNISSPFAYQPIDLQTLNQVAHYTNPSQ